jgi:hypothetical protein
MINNLEFEENIIDQSKTKFTQRKQNLKLNKKENLKINKKEFDVIHSSLKRFSNHEWLRSIN